MRGDSLPASNSHVTNRTGQVHKFKMNLLLGTIMRGRYHSEVLRVQVAHKGVTVDNSRKANRNFELESRSTNSLNPYIIVRRGIDRSSKASSLSESRTM